MKKILITFLIVIATDAYSQTQYWLSGDGFNVYNSNPGNILLGLRSPQGAKLSIDPGSEVYGLSLTSDQGQYGNYVQMGMLGRNMDLLQGRLLFNLQTSSTTLNYAGFDFRVKDKSVFFVNAEGNVGIGTVTKNPPIARLQIDGGPAWSSDGYKRSLLLGNQDAIAFYGGGYKFALGVNGSSLNFFSTLQETNAQLQPILSMQPNTVTIEGDLIVKGNVYSNGGVQQKQQAGYNSQAAMPVFQNVWTEAASGISYALGNVGIGTVTPAYKLHVMGEIYTSNGIRFADGTVQTTAASASSATSAPLSLWMTNGSNISFSQGNVGIGTSNPGQYKLAVEGIVGARKVVVTQQQWADYVFADGYELKSLEFVEKAIKRQKHLPGVPSSKDVAEQGLDIGNMQSKLLEKIEELTLYVIDLNKVNQKQSAEIEKLKQEIKKLNK